VPFDRPWTTTRCLDEATQRPVLATGRVRVRGDRHRPVVLDLGQDIEVVGQYVQREVADDLADLGVGHTGVPGGLHDVIRDEPVSAGDGVGQGQECSGVRSGRLRVPSLPGH
jgi:hypothetical protein